MQKTKEPIYLPLSPEALKWMPERGEKTSEDHVFDLPSPTMINTLLKPWAKAAGIDKRFSFHTSRHTFATMMLTLGADLYTTSKLLGHADVKMTQVYAKIIKSEKGRCGQFSKRIIRLKQLPNFLVSRCFFAGVVYSARVYIILFSLVFLYI